MMMSNTNYVDAVRDLAAGKKPTKAYAGMPKEDREKLKEEKKAEKAAAKVEGGYNIFTGPIKDNKGNVVVKAGEALNDGTLWSDIFFYAEGIQGEMPG